MVNGDIYHIPCAISHDIQRAEERRKVAPTPLTPGLAPGATHPPCSPGRGLASGGAMLQCTTYAPCQGSVWIRACDNNCRHFVPRYVTYPGAGLAVPRQSPM